jgi:hypothetical protein
VAALVAGARVGWPLGPRQKRTDRRREKVSRKGVCQPSLALGRCCYADVTAIVPFVNQDRFRDRRDSRRIGPGTTVASATASAVIGAAESATANAWCGPVTWRRTSPSSDERRAALIAR